MEIQWNKRIVWIAHVLHVFGLTCNFGMAWHQFNDQFCVSMRCFVFLILHTTFFLHANFMVYDTTLKWKQNRKKKIIPIKLGQTKQSFISAAVGGGEGGDAGVFIVLAFYSMLVTFTYTHTPPPTHNKIIHTFFVCMQHFFVRLRKWNNQHMSTLNITSLLVSLDTSSALTVNRLVTNFSPACQQPKQLSNLMLKLVLCLQSLNVYNNNDRKKKIRS